MLLAAPSNHAESRPYADLRPERVLQAVAEFGLDPDGRLVALNSFENRVYQVGIEAAPPVIVKFYRPGRWSDAAILEEHAFLHELAAAELAVLPPQNNRLGESLSCSGPYRYAVFRRFGGRPPELEDRELLRALGRLLARTHSLGSTRPFVARPHLYAALDPRAAAEGVLASPLLPQSTRGNYERVVTLLARRIEELETLVGRPRDLNLHGDVHIGNVLVRDERPWLVDFDDCMRGPAVQDLWMLLGPDGASDHVRIGALMDGYLEFADFDPREWRLVEALRARRLVYFAAWVARRWGDPAFPLAFPWFGAERHWDEQVDLLRDQVAVIEDILREDCAA